ncbi:MAG: acyltransferase family protein [Sphingobacteriales bacterium]
MKDLGQKIFADIVAVPQSLQGNYFRSFDGLRGIAILMVICHHFGVNHFLHGTGIFIDSDTGVHIFFVLSGFLITTLLLKEKLNTGVISLKHFYIRRILRILPVAYLFLLVLIVLNACLHLQIQLIDFITSFLFFKNLSLRNEPYTAHLWSLAVEEQFYIIFPFLLSYNTNRYLILALTIIIGVAVISILGNYHVSVLFANPAIAFLTRATMYSFWKGPVIILVGSVFSILVFKGIIKPEKLASNYFLGFALLVIAITIHSQNFVFYIKYLSEFLSAIFIAYAIVLSVNNKNFLSGIMENGILVKIGILSYSLYIWQELFIGSRAWEPWLQMLDGSPLYLIIVIKVWATFIIAGLSYYLFESKFLKLKSRFK